MKQYITLVVSLTLLITCVIEIGRNITPLFKHEKGSVLYIETNRQADTPTTHQDLLEFDYTIDELPNTGS